MADEIDAAGISWWSTARTSSSGATTSFEGLAAITAASASCSAAIVDVGSSGPPIDSSPSLQVPMDWDQSLLRSSNRTGKAHEPSSFHAMRQDSLNCPQEQFLVDHGHHHQQHQQLQLQQPGSMLLQGLFDITEVKPQAQSIFDQRSLNYQPSPTMTTMIMGPSSFPPFLKSSPPKQQQASSVSSSHLQSSNNTAFWNAPTSAVSSNARPGFYPSMMPVQSYEQKPSCSSLTTTKSNSDSVQKRSTGSGGGSSEPALQKTRVEMPSPLPTFRVRKEKLGDRITALQQLASPFGKTDTASVLHEAIEYIKFLHDQVTVLSTPYLKNGHPMQHQQKQSSDESKDCEGPEQDLRSRGLCLVPIESTYLVASETTADYWTPTFGGSYG